jgi:hypothetical protein
MREKQSTNIYALGDSMLCYVYYVGRCQVLLIVRIVMCQALIPSPDFPRNTTCGPPFLSNIRHD